MAHTCPYCDKYCTCSGDIDDIDMGYFEACTCNCCDDEELDDNDFFDDEDTDKCRVCGCTNWSACPDPETGTCWWVEEDLCSACATPEQKEKAIHELKSLGNG